MVDLNLKYLGEIERGGKTISIEALQRIAKTGTPPFVIFSGACDSARFYRHCCLW
jgi:hypothetical protein